MKNFKKIAFGFLMAFVMILAVACSSKSGKSSTYVLDKKEGKATVVLYHDDKDVNNMEMDAQIDTSSLGLQPQQIEQMKQSINIVKGALTSIKGLDTKIDFADNSLNFKITVDYSKVDMEQLKGLSQMAGKNLPFDLNQVKDFKSAEKNLLDSGFVKK